MKRSLSLARGIALCAVPLTLALVGSRLRADETGGDALKKTVTILFAGDTSFGENYQISRQKRGEENILESKGYGYSLSKLQPLLSKSDFVIANLETPLTSLRDSPLAGKKRYIHHSDAEKALKAFKLHNIRIFSLGNNHSI